MRISSKLATIFVLTSLLIIIISGTLFYAQGLMVIEGGNLIQLESGLILIMSGLVMFSVVLGLFFSRSFTDPVKKLMVSIDKMAKGKLDVKIDVSRNDEFGDLARAFNEMQFKVKQSETALEKEVEKRTEDLNETISKLKKSEGAAKQIAENLASAIERQKKMEKSKIEFLTITSHELRTPITPMKAQLQMVLCEYFGKINDEQRKSMDLILKNMTILDTLIGDILDISKLDSGVMKFDIQKENLNNVVESSVNLMRIKSKDKKISITLESQGIPPVMIDRDRINQVVLDLLNNAIKFTGEGGKIMVSISDEINHAVVSVKDNGIGIAEKDQGRIFEPFEQVDSSMARKFEGTGLGLAVCRGIIEKHGGKISIKSQPGKGSTFLFTIPYESKKRPEDVSVELFTVNAGEKQ